MGERSRRRSSWGVMKTLVKGVQAMQNPKVQFIKNEVDFKFNFFKEKFKIQVELDHNMNDTQMTPTLKISNKKRKEENDNNFDPKLLVTRVDKTLF